MANQNRHPDASGCPRPLLFITTPFGVKEEPGGARVVDFDRIHLECLEPAAEAAEVESIRADEEAVGGIIHKAMYERLLLAEIVVADLTFANANVFYELGIRHAARPRSTILIYAKLGQLPFDVAPIRAIPYEVGPEGEVSDPDALRSAIAERLEVAKNGEGADSPLFQLLSDYPGVTLPHETTEAFRERARWVSELTVRANEATRAEPDAAREELARIEAEISPATDRSTPRRLRASAARDRDCTERTKTSALREFSMRTRVLSGDTWARAHLNGSLRIGRADISDVAARV